MKNAVWDDDELASIRNVDRLLPSQPYFSRMYKGDNFYGDMERLMLSMLPSNNFDIQTKLGMTYAVMGSDINTLRFYQMLIRMNGYKRILELGTYIGVSAMYMAEAGASVTTVEKGEEFYKIACENISNNGFERSICTVHGDATLFLEEIENSYDFILIDCAKESYKELLELSLPRLSHGGLILIDDVFFQGDTLNNAATSEKGVGVRRMLEYAAVLDRWEKIILPIGNGLLMMQRR